MLQHYFKIALRNLFKYKIQSIISIVGLAVGFTCFSLAALWIRYELTYDDFHEGADLMYLAGMETKTNNDSFSISTSYLLADHLKTNFPEVESACHICYQGKNSVSYQDSQFEMRQLEVDSTFSSMFQLTILKGDTKLLLLPDHVAITERAAKRIFGKESPIGKNIYIGENKEEKTIIAVVKEWEGHSSFNFDILLPLAFADDSSWNMSRGSTLLRIHPTANLKLLQEKFKKIEVQQDQHIKQAPVLITPLQTLRSMHPIENVFVKLNHIYLFACIGGLVVLCGLFNYLSIFAVRIRMRGRELALRKVNGASGNSLVVLLIIEFISLLFVSLFMGLFLIEVTLPTFKELSQINETTSFFYLESAIYLLALIVITLLLLLLFVGITRKQTLHNNISMKAHGHVSNLFRKVSLVFQLAISIGFIFCTVVMMKQLDFLHTSDEMGWKYRNIGAITYVKGVPAESIDKILPQVPTITQTLKGYFTPIPKFGSITYTIKEWEDKPDNIANVTIEESVIGKDFMDFFHVTLLEGSIPDEKEFKNRILINESACKAFGWDHPIGKKISDFTIQGVIKDIHYGAPTLPIFPVLYHSFYDPDVKKNFQSSDRIFKFREGSWKQTVTSIETLIHKEAPDSKIYFSNMEEEYNKYLKSEDSLMKILGVVSILCIIISVFGVFSLITLSCEQRRKEIAIRKVNGASVGSILHLFFSEYLTLLIVASIIAFPIGYLIMNKWLSNYIKQTTIEGWIYVAILVSITCIIIGSIFWRVWKAARQNPAEVIKSE